MGGACLGMQAVILFVDLGAGDMRGFSLQKPQF